MGTLRIVVVALLTAFGMANRGEAAGSDIAVGVARIDITPDEPIRLSGYRTRREPTDQVDGRLWAKALAIGGDNEDAAVLITVELVGITRTMTDDLAAKLQEKAGITRERLAVCVTHTHTGPFVRGNLPNIFGSPIPKDHQQAIDRYANSLAEKLEKVALAALANRKPSRLSWTTGKVGFAANRRRAHSLKGRPKPVDHDLPALFVKDPQGAVRAVLVSYACHCVTLGGAFNRIHGDWAGAAAKMIEERHPGAIGMVAIGCGADQNPALRGLLPEVERNGQQIAEEVDRMLKGKTQPLTSVPVCRYELAKLPFGKLPDAAALEKRLKSKVERVRYYAGILKNRMARGIKPPKSMDYAIQTWTFGDDLGMVFLAGEVVVDYSLRLKRELVAERLWVNAYANDVPCYIASARVIREGGYEVDASMDSYDKPTRLDPAAENIIVDKVKEMLPKSFLQRRKLRADVKEDFWRDLPVPPAPILNPQEAIDSFRLPPGFRIETVAAEPLVEDPVTIAWDAAGRLWVAEMQGYMRTPEGAGENDPISKVAVLEDSDDDGIMDRRTVFLDGLVMPRAIAMVEGGVLIGEPPHLWYCRDTDGDLVCDERVSVSESYGQRDAVSRTSNGLLRGLDNWMVNARHPERFQFRNGQLVTAPDAYRGDWGVAQDDFGRIFANVNSSWLHADLIPVRYLLRHPNLRSPSGIYQRIAKKQDVHSIRLNTGVVAGHTVGMLRGDGRLAKTTAATAPTIYRGDRYPVEYHGNAFVPEPAGNVVGRFTLKQKGTGGKFSLVVKPLRGRGSVEGVGPGFRLLEYLPPANPASGDEWKTREIANYLHLSHNFHPVNWDDDPEEEFIIAAKEGAWHFDRKNGDWFGRQLTRDWSGEIRDGKLPNGRRFIATVEPMHGVRSAVYVQPDNHSDGWKRLTVLDDALKDGHAIAVADYLGVGSDQIVVGWRAMHPRGVPGIKLFTPLNKNGTKWRETLLSNGPIAVEDIKAGDLNGDGKPEIIAAARQTKNLTIFFSQ